MAKRNILSMIDDINRGLEELKDALSPLARMAADLAGDAGRRAGRIARAGRKEVSALGKRARKQAKRQVPASVKRMRRLQGKYLAALRQLAKVQRAKVKKYRLDKGVEAAVAFAKKLRK